MLCGFPPYMGQNLEEVKREIENKPLTFEQSDWEFISDEAKDLLKKMLNKNAQERIDAETALNHPWLKKNNHCKLNKNRGFEMFKRLRQFQVISL